MLDALDAGQATAVIAWHTDRLHRSPRELEQYVDICERRKILTQTVKAGELDLATPSGRAVARTLGAWARFESEHKSDRIKRAHEQAAHQGRWAGGGRPFGWQPRPDGSAVLDRAEAREVRKAATALLAGESLGSVVADLNARGVRSARGGRWNYTTVRQVLTRPRNAGLSDLHGEIVGKSTWPPILTEDTWRSVCALLCAPERRRSQTNRVRHLLAGIVLCSTCGAPMKSATAPRNRAQGTTRTVYRCPTAGVGHASRDADLLDDLVARVIVERLRRPDALTLDARDDQPDTEGARVEAVTLRSRLGEAADAFADGAITGSQLSKITKRVRDRLAEVEASMAVTSRAVALSDFGPGRDPAAVWDGLSIERQRAVIRELVTVTALAGQRRGGRFDPESVQVEWRAN